MKLCCMLPNVKPTEIVKLLLQEGADPIIRNNYGYTPLHIASEGKTILIPGLDGRTPLSVASFSKYNYGGIYNFMKQTVDIKPAKPSYQTSDDKIYSLPFSRVEESKNEPLLVARNNASAHIENNNDQLTNVELRSGMKRSY